MIGGGETSRTKLHFLTWTYRRILNLRNRFQATAQKREPFTVHAEIFFGCENIHLYLIFLNFQTKAAKKKYGQIIS